MALNVFGRIKALSRSQRLAVGSSVLGAGIIAAGATKAIRSYSKKRKRRTHNKRTRSPRRKSATHRKRKRRTPRTAGKRKDTSRKRIRYTKRGQPYVIMANGRARFIKQKGARLAHKRKGGRY